MRLNSAAVGTDWSIPLGHWRPPLWPNCMWHWPSGAAVEREKAVKTNTF